MYIRARDSGYTMMEILIVVVVLSVMASILLVGYGTWQRSMAIAAVQNDLTQGAVGLKNFKNFNNGYPPNLAGINFVGSPNVALAFWTNAAGVPVYENLTPNQNAQLLLFSCNAYMPIVDNGTTYNTSCSFAGKNIHVSGQRSTNIVLKGPTVTLEDFKLKCGVACDEAQQNILEIFEQQGGTWPLSVSGDSVSLPSPTDFSPTSNASAYCLQGTSPTYDDIVFHITNSDSRIQNGPCPENPELHYP